MSRDRMREIVSEKICFGRSDIFAANILRGSGHESGERIELGHLGSADLAALSNHFPQSTFIDKNRTLLKGTRHVVPTMGAALRSLFPTKTGALACVEPYWGKYF